MISNVGSASLAQALPAQAGKTRIDDEAAPAAPPAADGAPVDSGLETRSALSEASARVGDQLQAQSHAARVQRAVDAAPADEADEADQVDRAAGGTDTKPAPPAGARPAGGAAKESASTSETEAADYVAEADTNLDKKVSDQERIAYEKKLEQQAQEVRQAYAPEEPAAPSVAVTA